MQEVVIVGAGISGLAAAYFLEQLAAEAGVELSIDLIESRDRLGGVILSERAGGFLVEGGPDSFLTQKPAAIDLCRALSLSGQLIPSNDRQRKTYILQGGRLQELPDGLMFMLPTKVGPVLRSGLFSLSGKIRLAVSPLLSPPRARQDDVSVSDYISQRLGRQALERLAEPLLSAVYGADVTSLSANAVLPRLLEMEKKYGSLWKAVRHVQRATAAGKSSASTRPASLFMSLRDGIGELPNALQKKLTRTRLAAGTEITGISRVSPLRWRVRSRDGEAEAAALILAVPAHAAARLLEPVDPALTQQLAGISYHSTLTVSMGFEETTLGRALDGFGFVVPRGEGKRLVACTWVSTKYPFRCPPGRVLLRGFLGGARDPSIMQEDDASVLRIVLQELRDIMGVRSEPGFVRIHRWDRAMPQYAVGHPRRVEQIASLLAAQPGLFLAGNAYKGIGIPDCIDSASAAALAAFRHLQSLA